MGWLGSPEAGAAPLLASCPSSVSSGPAGLGLALWTSGVPGLPVWAWGVGDGTVTAHEEVWAVLVLPGDINERPFAPLGF